MYALDLCQKNDEFSNVHKLQNSKSFKFIHANLLIYFPTNLVYFQANLQLKMHSKSSFWTLQDE